MDLFRLIDEGDIDSIEDLLDTDGELVEKSNEEVLFSFLHYI